MMKTAFAYWDNRIAPVFDTARYIHVVEVESGKLVGETQENLPGELPFQKAFRLVDHKISVLVCGAISRAMHELVLAYGIQVIPFVAGDLQEVIRAWLNNNLHCDAFVMPGCRGRRGRRSRGTEGRRQEGGTMNARGYGRGGGMGRGQGAGDQRSGRMGGPLAAGPTGYCVCPQCGQKEPHERGVPCVERRCPNCGIAMTRQ